VPVSHAERLRYRVRTLPGNPHWLPCRSIELAIQLSEMDYLKHHKTGGMPTLPGAWIVEHMVRAVLRLADQPVRFVTVENVRFRRFVRSMHTQDNSFRVVVDSTPGGYVAWLLGDIVSSTGVLLASDQVFASAVLSIDQPVSVEQQSLATALDSSDVDCRAVSDPYCNGQESVQLSGPFDCLPRILVGPRRRSATFSPRMEHSWHDVVPSLLIDASIRVAGMHVVRDALHVPTGIRRMVLPVGVSSQSLEHVNWTIQASNPVVDGNDIHCGRVEVTDDLGSVRLLIEDAVVTKLR